MIWHSTSRGACASFAIADLASAFNSRLHAHVAVGIRRPGLAPDCEGQLALFYFHIHSCSDIPYLRA